MNGQKGQQMTRFIISATCMEAIKTLHIVEKDKETAMGIFNEIFPVNEYWLIDIIDLSKEGNEIFNMFWKYDGYTCVVGG